MGMGSILCLAQNVSGIKMHVCVRQESPPPHPHEDKEVFKGCVVKVTRTQASPCWRTLEQLCPAFPAQA